MGCLTFGIFSGAGFWIGLFTGGFRGALLGLLIGSCLDLILNLINGKLNVSNWSGQSRSHYNANNFIEQELVLAAYVAKSDNNQLLRSELEYLREFLSQYLAQEKVGVALLHFRDLLDSDTDITDVCNDIRRHATISEKLIILQFLFGFSRADGNMCDEEVQAIQDISDLCGISRSNFEAVKSMFASYRSYYNSDYRQSTYGGSRSYQSHQNTGSLENDYKILEITPDASDNDVKKAYRAAAKKHHPDKVAHLGEEVRKSAEIKFAQVNQAYERIKKSRGMN